MIVDKLENAGLYMDINSGFEKAFKFLKDNDLEKLEDGKYEIDSDKVFASVQTYVTKDEKDKKFESHKNYIDIQYIVKGKEFMGWTPLDKLSIKGAYSKEKDIAFYDDCQFYSKINVEDKSYCIFFPTDAHKPGCTFDKPTEIKKVVVKVKVK